MYHYVSYGENQSVNPICPKSTSTCIPVYFRVKLTLSATGTYLGQYESDGMIYNVLTGHRGADWL